MARLLALQPGLDQVNEVAGTADKVGHGLVLGLALLAVGGPGYSPGGPLPTPPWPCARVSRVSYAWLGGYPP